MIHSLVGDNELFEIKHAREQWSGNQINQGARLVWKLLVGQYS